MFDTFISYRREGGQNIANRVYDFLKTKNFSPFYDIEKMGAGRFDEQIRNNIIHAENFLLILSKGALDRCSEPGDWVLREIELAIENNLNIVVFQADSFEYPDDLPSRISLLKNYQVMFFSEVNLSSRM